MTGWDESDQVRFFTDEAAPVVAAQLSTEATAELVELHHRPGAGVSGLFEVIDDGTRRYLVATTEDVHGDLVEVEVPRGRLRIWEHPGDPLLPGLPLASVPAEVQATWGDGARLRSLETVTYRPLRRAVLRAIFDGGPGQVFLKVLRRDADLLALRHRLLSEAGVPVPRVVGPVRQQVVALSSVTGTPLAQAFMDSTEIPLDPARITDLVDTMPDDLITLPAREAWTDRIVDYASAAKVAFPAGARRIDAVVATVTGIVDGEPRGPVVATHGDLYEANLFVADGGVSGVIDVDAVGPGHAVDDLACFLAHLAVLRTIHPGYAHTGAFLSSYLDAFSAYVDAHGASRAGLLARTAAVACTLIAGARDEGLPDWETAADQRLRIAEGFAAIAWGSWLVAHPGG